MIIVGAKGLAKEVLEIFSRLNALEGLCFFDDVSADAPAFLFDRFPVLRSMDEVKAHFERTGDRSFTLGLGNPLLRYRLEKKFSASGGILHSAISPNAEVGSFGNSIGIGCTILSGAVITNSVILGKGSLINPHCSISHDSVIGEFVEISPGVSITGRCQVGSFSQLGTNAAILPGIHTGENVIVGAGAVVTKNIPANSMAAGVPAVVKKSLTPLNL